MADHTPTPWHSDDTAIFAQDGVLARIPNHPENGMNWQTDAAFIVCAVNNHDALVEAAQNLIEEISTRGTHERWKRLANLLHDLVECPVTPSECPLCPGFSAPCGNTNCPQLQSPADRKGEA